MKVENTTARGVRLPDSVWADLVKSAKKENRKLNNYIHLVLTGRIKVKK